MADQPIFRRLLKKLWLVVIFVGSVLVLGLLLVVLSERDPRYKGKRLSRHVEGLRGGIRSFGYSKGRLALQPQISVESRDPVALEAVDRVGTNALPMLVRMLGAKDSPAELWLRSLAEKHRWLGRMLPINRTHAWTRQMGALTALERLGPAAAPAVPGIIRLLDDPDCALQAIVALIAIRPERESDLLSVTNVFRLQTSGRFGPGRPYTVYSGALLALGAFGARATNATPLLVTCLKSTNDYIRASAAVAAARIGVAPNLALPLILAALPQTNPPPVGRGPLFSPGLRDMHMKRMALMLQLWAIGEYGRRATSALPALTNLQQDPLSHVREEAREAAERIKPPPLRSD